MAQKQMSPKRSNERRNAFMDDSLQHKNAKDFERFIKSLASRLDNKTEHILLDDLIVTKGKYSDQFHFSSLFNGWGTFLEFTLEFPPIDKEYRRTINELFLGVTISEERISALIQRIKEKLSNKVRDLEHTIDWYNRYIES